MSKAISGVGTQFRRWDPVEAEWVNLAEVNNLSGPDKSRETIDVTNLDSPDGYKEFIAGMRDAGTVTFSMNFTRAGYDLMNEDFESDDLQNYEILLPDVDETSFEFRGLVTELPLSITVDDKITCDCTIKLSGKATTNSGSGSAV